jgi:ATP-dependent helicase/nuclease subunit A
MPPYEFFAGLLEEHQMAMRHALIARLGPDAGDAIDEFLALALAWEKDNPPLLQGFLAYVRGADAEVKRDMEQGRDEVRVMTVFGAKGLEAEIVFLPDTCVIPRGQGGAAILDAPRAELPEGAPGHLVWVPPGTGELDPVSDAKARRDKAVRAEYHRLLYVAMTRAKDRLYVCGWETRRKRDKGCWYDLVSEGLKGIVQEASDGQGETVLRFETEPEEVKRRAGEPRRPPEPRPLPDWAQRDAHEERPAALPVAPSSILAHAEAGEEELFREQDADPPDRLADQSRFLRGKIIHALLQHLPAAAEADREERAAAYVAARGGELTPAGRTEIVEETLGILRDDQFAPLFAPGSMAEVPVAARIGAAGGAGQAFDITGQIDRLVVLDDAVLIVDYKTNRPPPTLLEDVADGYLAQLASYRAAIREIFPGKKVRAALLWTDGPRLMEMPQELLDETEAKIHARVTTS